MLRVKLKEFYIKFKAELLLLFVGSAILGLASQVFLHTFLNTFYQKHIRNSSEISALIAADIKKLVQSNPEENLNLDIIKNYEISSASDSHKKSYLGPNVLKLAIKDKTILIDLAYIKYLIDKLYSNSIRIDFSNAQEQQSIKALNKVQITDDVYLISHLKQSKEELRNTAKKVAYIFNTAILLILGLFYLMVRSQYLKKDALYSLHKQNQEDLCGRYKKALETKDGFRREEIKLTKLLYKPIATKLKTELCANEDDVSKASSIFSVITLEESQINLREFFASLRNLFYIIEFQIHTKSAETIKIGITYASFYQILYSIMDYVKKSLGDDKQVDLVLEKSESSLTVTIKYKPSEFANKVQISNDDLLHPFLMNLEDVFNVLERHLIHYQNISTESLSSIQITFPTKKETAVYKNNVRHVTFKRN